MYKHLMIAAAAGLGLAALPQVASAQSMDGQGYGQAGRAGNERSVPFHNEYRPFGHGAGMARGGLDHSRFHNEPHRFGSQPGFRVDDGQRTFGYGGAGRVHQAREFIGQDERVRPDRRFGYDHDFGRPGFRQGYRGGIVRPYRVYPVVGPRYGEGAFGRRDAGPYFRPAYRATPIHVAYAGYGFPRAGCSTHRSVSLTSLGWRKIVTLQTCYVR